MEQENENTEEIKNAKENEKENNKLEQEEQLENSKQEKTAKGASKGNDTIEIKKETETLKIKLEETEDRLKRIAAEFDNYKKRSNKEKEELYNSIMGDIVSSFLPVIDNLEKAVESKTEDEAYKQGVELVLKQFKDVLNANGVKEIEAMRQNF